MNKIVIAIILVVTPLACYARVQWAQPQTEVVTTVARTATEPSTKVEVGEKFGTAVGETEIERSVQSSNVLQLSSDQERFGQLLKASTQSKRFLTPEVDEVSRFEKLFYATLLGKRHLNELATEWAEDGWVLERIQLTSDRTNDGVCLVIYEAKSQQKGRGIYAIRPLASSNIVLQAPHRFFDQRSGTIVGKLFQESDCLAAAWNTVHRKQYDLAHQSNHFINAFTKAVLRYESEAKVIQVHGFASDNLQKVDRGVDVIVSDSTKYPGRLARASALNLKQNLGSKSVRLFPIGIQKLGGTKNEQGTLVRDAGYLGFLHLELSSDYRQKLDSSAQSRSKFIESLAE